jgi:hypothetical protein
MAVDDLGTLRQQLPEVFDDLPVPDRWDDEWLVVPIEEPEEGYQDYLHESVGVPGIEQEAASQASADIDARGEQFGDLGVPPGFGTAGRFPGGPVTRERSQYYPPPDAFAFYLPFHFFYPTWWGVYLVLEPTLELAAFVRAHSGEKLTIAESLVATRIFL